MGKASIDLKLKQDQLIEVEIEIERELDTQHVLDYRKLLDLYPKAIDLMREILNEIIKRKGGKQDEIESTS